jgi:hypothetical protein
MAKPIRRVLFPAAKILLFQAAFFTRGWLTISSEIAPKRCASLNQADLGRGLIARFGRQRHRLVARASNEGNSGQR